MNTSRAVTWIGGVLWIAGMIVFQPGCRDVSHLTTGDLPAPTSQVLKTQQFADIPVPRDFVLQSEPVPSMSFTGSYVYEAPPYREGMLLYTGKDTPDRVFDFYRTQMVLPVNGWRSIEEQPGSDGGELLFEKEGTRSHLHIFQNSGETCVMIEVSRAHEG